MKTFLVCVLFAAVMAVAFIKLTDRICTKTFSAAYKATAEYQAMQCDR